MERIERDFFLWKYDSNLLKSVLNKDNSIERQVDLLNRTVDSKVNAENPVDPQFSLKFIKLVIKLLETNFAEIDESLYVKVQELQDLAAQQDTRYFKSYFISDQIISLQETQQIISDGTTGLSSWTAGLSLSQYILQNKDQFRNKKILELGAGTGITGIACIKSVEVARYVFTDCHHKVLNNIRQNIDHNLPAATNYRVERLDWVEDNIDKDKLDADIILGADIVFDSRIIPDLVKVLRLLLSPRSTAIIASTIRNESTYDCFLSELSRQDLLHQSIASESETNVQILQISLKS